LPSSSPAGCSGAGDGKFPPPMLTGVDEPTFVAGAIAATWLA
jgi:hypothetical protein